MKTEAKPTKEEIIALETSYWEAMKAKDGARTSQLSGKVSLVTGAQGGCRVLQWPSRGQLARKTMGRGQTRDALLLGRAVGGPGSPTNLTKRPGLPTIVCNRRAS